MDTVGIGIVGCGMMGQLFAAIMADAPQVRLAGVMDVQAGTAESLGNQYGIPWTTSLETLLDRSEVDAVFIATPDTAHLTPCLQAAAAGKHILVEKPLAATTADAEAIIAAAEQAGVTLMVGHTLRFDPRYIAVRQALAAGRLGSLCHLVTRRAGPVALGRRLARNATIVSFLGVHEADILNWFAGGPPEAVYARGRSGLLADMGVDDTVVVILEYPGDVLATMEVSWALPQVSGPRTNPSFEVVGSEGMARVEGHQHGLLLFGPGGTEEPNVFYQADVYGQPMGIYRAELRHFVRSVLSGNQPAVTGADGLAAVRVVEAINRSLASGERVRLSEIA